MSELSESMHALRRAAGHLAQGTAEQLTPTYDRARHIAGQGLESTKQSMSPMYRQMRERAMSPRAMGHRKKKDHKRSRMRTLRGLLVTGAAVGAASAAVARRRRQQAEWADYERMGGFDESRYAEGAQGGSAKQKMASGAASMADTLSARAGRIADSLHERSASMQEKAGGQQREGEGSSVPLRGTQVGTGPGPVGTPSMMGSSQPATRERLGDPALDFPEER